MRKGDRDGPRRTTPNDGPRARRTDRRTATKRPPIRDAVRGAGAPTTGHVAIEWPPEVPAPVRREAEPLIARWALVLPTWCHTLVVYWRAVPSDVKAGGNDDGSGVTAYTEAMYEYREACITLTATWLEQPRASRERIILHEIIHVLLWPMEAAQRATLKAAKKGQPAALREALEEHWRLAQEGAVCDLTRTLERVRQGA